MTADQFIRLLKQPALLTESDCESVGRLWESHPYFGAAASLYLKGLHDGHDLRYAAMLPRVALTVADRKRLQEYLEAPALGIRPGYPADYPLNGLTADGPKMKHGDLIDQFIETDPRIQPIAGQKAEGETLPAEPVKTVTDSIFTESLAVGFVLKVIKHKISKAPMELSYCS